MPISAPPKTSYPPTKDGALWAAARAGKEAEVRALLDDAARERDETKAEVQDDFQKLRQALKGVEGRCQRMTKDAEAVERRVDGAEQKLDQTQKRSTAHGAQLKDAAKRLDQLEADLEVVTETDLEDLRADLAAHKEAFASYADATAARLDEHAAAQRATAATVKGYENDVYHVFPGTLREQDAVLAAMKKARSYVDDVGEAGVDRFDLSAINQCRLHACYTVLLQELRCGVL